MENVIVWNSQAARVRQQDLELLMLYRRELRQLRESWKAKHDEIREALRHGARIEPGVHVAKLETRSRAGKPYEILEVF